LFSRGFFQNGGWFGIQFLEGLVLRISQKVYLPAPGPFEYLDTIKDGSPAKWEDLDCPKVSVVFFLAILFG